jgi:ATP-dependent Lon protease
VAKAKKTKKEAPEQREEAMYDIEEVVFPSELPVLPARDLVAFPAVMMSFYVGRPSSVKAIEQAQKAGNFIFVLSQKNEQIENPTSDDLFRVGVVASIGKVLKLSDQKYKILIQGIVRGVSTKIRSKDGIMYADVRPVVPEELPKNTKAVKARIAKLIEQLQILVEQETLAEDLLMLSEEIEDPGVLADVILAHLKPELHFAQSALEEFDPMERFKLVENWVTETTKKLKLSEEIRDKTEGELMKGQREYFLREQLKQIRHELGDDQDSGKDLAELKAALEKAKLPKVANDEAMKQLRRLEHMSPESGDAALLRTYLDWVIDLPWSNKTRDRMDIKLAKEILDEDHFGLEKVKDRILEYLSVKKLNPDSKGPILCLVGPPGVGKTSLGKSVAKALNRNFHRMSLGGVRDEAEIRGHRRTYVGALPGRIIQGMKHSGSVNPVFVLDELDKVGADFRGDPAAALLEVLDPNQNREFVDHYLNVPYDLSQVMFFATANTTDTIPSALLDRLEVIRIAGYTTEEKLAIAEKYIIPRQLNETGLANENIDFDPKALELVIERYTLESGVRNLEREIGSLCRKVARQRAEKKSLTKSITVEAVKRFLGPTKFDPDADEKIDSVGVAMGLAWTIYGGETMLVEASVAKGKGALILTGQLGDVMKESAQAAIFYARANAVQLGLDPDFHDKLDIHVHCPSGATPKDGPSAGITIAAAVISALSERKISREYAMTGEVTLRGNVLAVGGVKEKSLAALRQGIKKVIIPVDCVKDLQDIPKEQREQIEFIPVKHISEVLEKVLLGVDKAVKVMLPPDKKGFSKDKTF